MRASVAADCVAAGYVCAQDMGFASTVDAILKALPTERQTMLFSATPEKRVRNLARVSLREPEVRSGESFVPHARDSHRLLSRSTCRRTKCTAW